MNKTQGRKSTRLQAYNYSTPGLYFITICVHNHSCLFGNIKDGEMRCNQLGKILEQQWKTTISSFPGIKSDEWVVMPNHFHGLIHLLEHSEKRLVQTNTNDHAITTRRKMLIPKVVGKFKMQTSKLINQVLDRKGKTLWMRGYWDRVVRNEAELHRIREYIVNNPLKWELDRLNPKNNL